MPVSTKPYLLLAAALALTAGHVQAQADDETAEPVFDEDADPFAGNETDPFAGNDEQAFEERANQASSPADGDDAAADAGAAAPKTEAKKSTPGPAAVLAALGLAGAALLVRRRA